MARKLLFILITLVLSGCVEKQILDDLSIESAIGFDLHDDNKILGTALVPNYQPDHAVKNVTYTTVGEMNRELFVEMQRQTADPLVIGSLEVVLFGEKLAEKGVIDLIDALQRDASIGERLFLAVADGKSNELLEQSYGQGGNATFISNLIEHNINQRDVPTTNLHMFIFDFFQKGKDPFLPKLKKIGKDKLEINGISLFKQDKVVDFIPANKMFFFKLLVDKYSLGSYNIDVKSEQAAVRNIKSNKRMDLTKKNPPEITIHIKIKGAVQEYTGDKLTPKQIKEIEKNLEKTVSKESLKLINHFKEIGVDPLGLGHYAKTRTRKFDQKKWEENYKQLAVKVKTEANIIEAGVIE